jgi:hypothetical protein
MRLSGVTEFIRFMYRWKEIYNEELAYIYRTGRKIPTVWAPRLEPQESQSYRGIPQSLQLWEVCLSFYQHTFL